jgi:hypothetical protein
MWQRACDVVRTLHCHLPADAHEDFEQVVGVLDRAFSTSRSRNKPRSAVPCVIHASVGGCKTPAYSEGSLRLKFQSCLKPVLSVGSEIAVLAAKIARGMQ